MTQTGAERSIATEFKSTLGGMVALTIPFKVQEVVPWADEEGGGMNREEELA
jgi:hypothetical protein